MAARGRRREQTTLVSVAPMVARRQEVTAMDSVVPMLARGQEVKVMDSKVMEARDKVAPVAMRDGVNVQISLFFYLLKIDSICCEAVN